MFKTAKKKTISVEKVMEYMREWMDCSAIKSTTSDLDYYYFSAKRQGDPMEFRAERHTADDSFDIWERDNDLEIWEWTDAKESL